MLKTNQLPDCCLQHKHFVVLMERLAEHPLAYKEEEFIVKHRRKLMMQSFATDIPKVLNMFIFSSSELTSLFQIITICSFIRLFVLLQMRL